MCLVGTPTVPYSAVCIYIAYKCDHAWREHQQFRRQCCSFVMVSFDVSVYCSSSLFHRHEGTFSSASRGCSSALFHGHERVLRCPFGNIIHKYEYLCAIYIYICVCVCIYIYMYTYILTYITHSIAPDVHTKYYP